MEPIFNSDHGRHGTHASLCILIDMSSNLEMQNKVKGNPRKKERKKKTERNQELVTIMHHILWQINPRGNIIIIATWYSSFIFDELSFSPTLEVRNALHFCLMFDVTE